MAVGVTLRDFCENTSVHGLAFVVESKSSILKRLAWMTIFLMCLSYAIMQIKESIDGRLRNSKAMKSSPLLGPFCGSEFWEFSLLKI